MPVLSDTEFKMVAEIVSEQGELGPSFDNVATGTNFARAALIDPLFKAKLADVYWHLLARHATNVPPKLLVPIAPLFRDLEREAAVILSRPEMQHTAPVEASETETADAPSTMLGMIPLTQSKMHAQPAPMLEQSVLPRRSAPLYEIQSVLLVAVLAVSALVFNFATPGRLLTTPSGVTLELPPKPAAAVPAEDPAAREDHSVVEAAPPSSAALPDVQPQAGSHTAPIAESPAVTAALPPAAAPVAPDAATAATSKAMPEPASAAAPAPATAPALVEETASLALPAEEVEALIRHGDKLLGIGDIVAARSTYERAFAGGNRVAAMGVAKTYDPLFLTQARVKGLRGDPARAALWYGKAAAAGDRDAQQRVMQLRAQFPSVMGPDPREE